MLIEGVLVPCAQAQNLLTLAMVGREQYDRRGVTLPAALEDLLVELGRAARSSVPIGSDAGSEQFPAATMVAMRTSAAAARLGITTRAVIKRVHAGTIRGEKQPDGAWLVEVPEAMSC